MRLRIIMIAAALVLGLAGNVPHAPASEAGNTEIRDFGMDRGADKASNPFGKSFGLDDEWGDVDPDDMKDLAEGLRKASPEDFQAAINLLLNPDVSLEDAVAAILFVLAEGMDEAIKDQAKKIDELQHGGGPQTAGEAPSIDREMQKLQKQTERRAQLFDTMKAATEKYEESAKGPIQAMRN